MQFSCISICCIITGKENYFLHYFFTIFHNHINFHYHGGMVIKYFPLYTFLSKFHINRFIFLYFSQQKCSNNTRIDFFHTKKGKQGKLFRNFDNFPFSCIFANVCLSVKFQLSDFHITEKRHD